MFEIKFSQVINFYRKNFSSVKLIFNSVSFALTEEIVNWKKMPFWYNFFQFILFTFLFAKNCHGKYLGDRCKIKKDIWGYFVKLETNWRKVYLKRIDSWAKKLNNFLSAKAMKLIFVLMCRYYKRGSDMGIQTILNFLV